VKFQESPSIYHTKHTARLLMLLAALSYPIIGIVFNWLIPGVVDTFLHGALVSSIILVFFGLTYSSISITEHLDKVVLGLYYLITLDAMYLCSVNEYHESYKLGLLVVIFASAVIMSNNFQIALYALFIMTWLLFSRLMDHVSFEENLTFTVITSLTLLFSFAVMKVKNHMYHRLILSDQIINNADSFVLLFNRAGELIFVNPNVKKILGYRDGEILGNGWWDIRSKNQTSKYTDKAQLIAIINGANPHSSDYRNSLFTKRSDLLWVDWQISRSDDQLILIGHDTTPTVLYEEKHAELSIVAQSSKDMVIIADKHNKITWVNNAFTEITGYSFREALGKEAIELFQSRKIEPNTVNFLEEKIKNKESFEIEIVNIGKNGEEFWASLRTRIVLDDKGEIEKFVTLGNDITKSKEVAEKLTYNAMRSEIMRNLDKVILTSKSTRDIVDYALGAVLKLISSCDRLNYISYDMDKRQACIVKDVSRKKTHFHNVREFNFKTISGIDELIKGNSFSVPDLINKKSLTPIDKVLYAAGLNSYIMFPVLNDGKLVGSLNIASRSSDVFTDNDRWIIEEIVHEFSMAFQQRTMETTISNNNEELLNSNTQLKRLNEELRQFAHVVSHDLKAPLRAIVTLADFIALDHKDGLGSSGKKQLNLLKGRTKRMGDLIEGILQYSQVEIEMSSSSKIEVQTVVRLVLSTLAPEKHINITIQSDLPVINADNIRIQQVFQNIMSNAIKYCNQNEGKIELGCTDADDFWEFFIKDNGDGIDEMHHERIFKIFQTLKPRDEMENTGIGLTITKKIIERYGGSIWLKSSIGLGTTFYFTLPKIKS
jgi:PAS domain S-box-containing protein